jgi:hypothetical protein
MEDMIAVVLETTAGVVGELGVSDTAPSVYIEFPPGSHTTREGHVHVLPTKGLALKVGTGGQKRTPILGDAIWHVASGSVKVRYDGGA